MYMNCSFFKMPFFNFDYVFCWSNAYLQYSPDLLIVPIILFITILLGWILQRRCISYKTEATRVFPEPCPLPDWDARDWEDKIWDSHRCRWWHVLHLLCNCSRRTICALFPQVLLRLHKPTSSKLCPMLLLQRNRRGGRQGQWEDSLKFQPVHFRFPPSWIPIWWMVVV